MTFEESVKYLLSLGNEVSTMKLGLENIATLLAALNFPQNNYLKVQVAGTNGKGSTCVFLDSICRETGIKTGLYTSPHLISITERIKIDGAEISEKAFAQHATRVRIAAEKLFAERSLEYIPTFYEQITAIALLAFAEAEIELAILETGLGGRLDATTAAGAEIAAITPIDIDHQQYLGNTIEEIAAEKAAIIHKNSKVVIAPQMPEAEKVLLERCREFEIVPARSSRRPPDNVKLKMAGRHQQINASLAEQTGRVLRKFGYKITDENIKNGLEKAVHAGRLEYLDGILFDGAHNKAGAKALAAYLEEFVAQPITLIFGAMNDKDVSEIAASLFLKAFNLILTPIDNSRSALPGALLKLVPATFPKDNVFLAENAGAALAKAKSISKNGLICVTGSLYLVGEIQKIMRDKR